MELEEHRAQFAARGLGVCAISYDAVDVLATFAGRKGITIPLLSDPDSDVTRRFGLLNATIPVDNAREYGIPNPGTFLVDAQGVVRGKYFEEDYVHRYTMPTLLFREFGLLLGRRTPVPVPGGGRATGKVGVATLAVQDRVRPGNRLSLIVEVAPAPGVHVYAPGAETDGYHPVALTLEPPPHCTIHPPRYPAPETIEIAGLGERVPVYAGTVQVSADLVLGNRRDLADMLAEGKVTVRGRLALQACDETTCDPPTDVPLVWELALEAPDTERVPEPLRREVRKVAT